MAGSYSLNFTIVGFDAGGGFITAYPSGTTRPGTSTANYGANPAFAVSNSAIIPANGSGSIDVYSSGNTTLIIDINGYFMDNHAMNTGDSLALVGTINGGGVMVSQNASTVSSSSGVIGQITAASAGAFSAGVRGINSSTSGNGIGVYGSQAGSGWGGYFTSVSGIGSYATGGSGLGVRGDGTTYGVYGLATGATGIGVYGTSSTYNGVWANSTSWDAVAAFGGRDGAFLQGARYGAIGSSNSTTGVLSGLIGTSVSVTSGATGVLGQAANGGYTFGVKGTTASTATDAAGVKGVSGYGDPLGDTTDCGPCWAAGVRGATDSTFTSFGVLGIGRNRGTTGFVMAPAPSIIINAQGILGYFDGTNYFGEFAIGNTGATGTKNFIEPHKTDPSRVVRYVSLEGPEAGTYFRGSAETRGGEAIIEVPDSFRQVTVEEGMTVQVTPVGDLVMVAVMSQDLNQIVVHSSKDVKFHYLVQGVRQGYVGYEPIVESNAFVPEKASSTMPMGLNDAQKAKLVANGTYNRDGSVNMQTAVRMGWAQKWREEEAARTRAAAGHN